MMYVLDLVVIVLLILNLVLHHLRDKEADFSLLSHQRALERDLRAVRILEDHAKRISDLESKNRA